MNENDLIFEAYMKKDKIEGGLADNKSCQDIADKWGVPLEDIKAQMEMGVKVEMEHTNDKDISIEIAHDHLWEFPDYYTALEEMEKTLKKKWGEKE